MIVQRTWITGTAGGQMIVRTRTDMSVIHFDTFRPVQRLALLLRINRQPGLHQIVRGFGLFVFLSVHTVHQTVTLQNDLVVHLHVHSQTDGSQFGAELNRLFQFDDGQIIEGASGWIGNVDYLKSRMYVDRFRRQIGEHCRIYMNWAGSYF